MASLRSKVATWVFRAGSLRAGQVIEGRYEISERLSSGATAEVFKVRHHVLGRPFALKVLKHECCRDAEFVGRLLREARALAALTHPNIVAITDSGRLETGEPYFVMEHVEGTSLQQLLAERGRLEPALAVEIAIGVCEALEAAHQAGIIHRDLKPDNVYVLWRGGATHVKVLDFGLARILGEARLTRPRTAQGTPEYMSPEQATGQEVDARSDIYSLAVTLYEMLCGRLPFTATSYVALAHQHMYAPPPPFSRWLQEPGAWASLEALVMRCLAKDRRARPSSAKELARALASAKLGDPTLRLLRSAEQAPASTEARARGGRDESARNRRLRPASIAQWALVGCCVGTIALALAYWAGLG